jgi:hypothetical protein
MAGLILKLTVILWPFLSEFQFCCFGNHKSLAFWIEEEETRITR